MRRAILAVLLAVAAGCGGTECSLHREAFRNPDGSSTVRLYDATPRLVATCTLPVADLEAHPELVVCRDAAGALVAPPPSEEVCD